MLDLYEFCTEEYKKALEGPRKAWQEAEDVRAGLEKAAKASAKSAAKDDKAREVQYSCPAPIKVQTSNPAQNRVAMPSKI